MMKNLSDIQNLIDKIFHSIKLLNLFNNIETRKPLKNYDIFHKISLAFQLLSHRYFMGCERVRKFGDVLHIFHSTIIL